MGYAVRLRRRFGVLHAYDGDLQPLLESSLAEWPAVQALRERFAIPDGDLRNYSAVSHWRRTTVAFSSPQSTKPGAVTARAG